MRSTALFLATAMIAAPALGQQQDDPLAPLDPAPTVQEPIVQPVTPPAPPRVIPKDWRGIFGAIDGGDWEGARLGIAAMPDNSLKPLAKAELFTARGSPAVDLASIQALLAEAPELPRAEQLARLAVTRGALQPPLVYRARPVVSLGTAPRRGKTRQIEGEPAADALRLALEPFVKVDDGPGAEALYLQAVPTLSYESRAEAANRVAWIYFVSGRDADARRVADEGRYGATSFGRRQAWAARAAQ